MNVTEKYTGLMPAGWTGGQSMTKWWRGRHMHLYTLTRPCAECGNEMRIDVTKAALDGSAYNAGLKLRRCAKCRATTAALKTTSRPKVEGEAPPQQLKEKADTTAAAMLATMKEEVSGLYAENKQLRTEADVLRMRLAKYELAPAMERVANGSTQSGHKMPWES